jgi:hypothetical protein
MLLMALEGSTYSGAGYEYEVRGTITQTITDPGAPVIRTTNEFTVCVRDRAWLILTTRDDGKAHAWHREVGSNNGTEIYDSNGRQAVIYDTGIPVELLDKGLDGHLWLMFASGLYWTDLRTQQLVPVFDWRASVGANPNRRVSAEWELLNGPGSLPREVRYLGEWHETNGLYRISRATSVNGMLVPTGFVFEEAHVGASRPNSLVHEMVVRKRVEAEVTSVQPVCSRKSLLPMQQAGGATIAVDFRLKGPNSGNQIPTYVLRGSASWPSVDEARRLRDAQILHGGPGPEQLAQPHRLMVIGAVVCILAMAPVGFYLLWRVRRGATGRR